MNIDFEKQDLKDFISRFYNTLFEYNDFRKLGRNWIKLLTKKYPDKTSKYIKDIIENGDINYIQPIIIIDILENFYNEGKIKSKKSIEIIKGE